MFGSGFKARNQVRGPAFAFQAIPAKRDGCAFQVAGLPWGYYEDIEKRPKTILNLRKNLKSLLTAPYGRKQSHPVAFRQDRIQRPFTAVDKNQLGVLGVDVQLGYQVRNGGAVRNRELVRVDRQLI